MAEIRAENVSDADGMVMRKEELNSTDSVTSRVNGALVAGIVIIALLVVFLVIRRRRKSIDF